MKVPTIAELRAAAKKVGLTIVASTKYKGYHAVSIGVIPEDGGKPVMYLTPAERRVMMAGGLDALAAHRKGGGK